MENGEVLEVGDIEEIFLRNIKGFRKLIGEESIILLKGINIKILFFKDIFNEVIIMIMVRELNIDVFIIFGKLE